jgi:hypothetical protein
VSASAIPTSRRLLWIAAAIVAAVAFYATARHKRDFVDFEVYRVAATRAIAAEPLYRADDGHFQYKYWPAFALAMAPFAALDPELGKAIWFAVSVALLIGLVDRSIAALPDRRRSTAALGWITALLVGKHVVRELVNGQANVLFAALLVLALLAAQRRRPYAAGALVGIAVFVKPYAMLMLPWVAAAAGIRAVAASGAVLALGLLAPALVYGWRGNLQQLAGWYETVTSTTPENLLVAENISFATMWAKWIGPGPTASAMALATGAAALLVPLAAWLRRRGVASPAYLELATLLLLVPLLSPQGWDYVLIVATPAVVLLVDRWRDLSPAWRVAAAVSFMLTSFAIYDVLGRSLYFAVMAISAQSVAVVLLLSALLWLRWHRAA